MLNVRDHISPTIAEQFPALYREEGDFLVQFVKAYYEFNEERMDRNIPKLRDIDTTLASFLIFFKKKYLNSLPLDTIVDTRFIIKHIQDLYKRKGSEESLRLLFRLFYDEDIEVFYPSTAILRPSDSIWGGAVYLELKPVNSVDDYPVQRGDKLTGDVSGASAFVDDIIFVNFSGALTPITYLSNLSGTFIADDSINVTRLGVTTNYGKLLSGSISEVIVDKSNRSSGQNIGDIITLSPVSGIGTSATGTVRSISTTTSGKIDYELVDGGFGYSTAPANATSVVKAAALALNESRISNQVVIIQNEVSAIKIGDYIEADRSQVNDSFGTVDAFVNGGGRVTAYNHPLLYIKTEDRTKDEFFTYVYDQLVLAAGGNASVNTRLLAVFNTETTDLATNYRLGDINNSGFSFITSKYITTDDSNVFSAYKVGVTQSNSSVTYGGSVTTAQKAWIEDRLLPAIYTAGFGHTFTAMPSYGISTSIRVGSTASVPITTISAYNASGTFDVTEINNTETVNIITDSIGDFASKPLAVIINASAMVANGIYEIETTSGTTYSDSSSQTIGTRFTATGPETVGSGTVIDVVLTNYGMSGTLLLEGFNAETINTKIADAFESKEVVIGSISGINTTNPGTDYVNDVFTEIDYLDISRFDKRDAIITFANPDFLLQVGDIVTQTVQIEDPTLETDSLVSYVVKGRFLKRINNDFYFRKLSFYDFDKAFQINIKNNLYTLTDVRQDINSLPMGKNANVSGIASYEQGQIDTVSILNTGYRYKDREEVLIRNASGAEVAKATVRTLGAGSTEGRWSSSTSFLSDRTKYIHDNDYYQEYSYDISTIIDPEKYTSLIEDTVGVAGTKVFSSPLINTNSNINSTLDVEFQVWNLSTENYVTEGSETIMTEGGSSEALVAEIVTLDTTATSAVTTSIGT